MVVEEIIERLRLAGLYADVIAFAPTTLEGGPEHDPFTIHILEDGYRARRTKTREQFDCGDLERIIEWLLGTYDSIRN